MRKLLLAAALLATSFAANSAVTLHSGDAYFASFSLVSDGNAFKETDLFWDVGALVNFAGPSADLTVTAYEDIAGTQQVFSGAFPSLFSGGRGYIGSNDDVFSDLSGSFRITNTGTNAVEVVEVVVSNFAGSIAPSFVATATITPSAVPLPAAAWLFVPVVAGLLRIGRRGKPD
tara:strand:- start:200 stop:721 length:522 start_codon:yes stop_codon:yes gene_type:complete